MNELFKFAEQHSADIERRREILKKGETQVLTIGELDQLAPEQVETYWSNARNSAATARVMASIERSRHREPLLLIDNEASYERNDYVEPRGFNEDDRREGGHQPWETGE